MPDEMPDAMPDSATVPAPDLSALGRGLADAVHGAQALFRAVLTAQSYPGRVQSLPAEALAGLQPPNLPTGLTALLLTLLDRETSLHLHPALGTQQAAEYLRFHTGVRTTGNTATAAFVAMAAAQATPQLWQQLNAGSDSQPQDGATLLIEVPALFEGGAHDSGRGAACTLLLNGPGIRRQARLAVAGPGPEFWQARIRLQADYPRGVDLLLCCGRQLAALPRSTQLALEG
jgi:alpha-D-ribose 1-methylphosphonate 5-triphosphate synthase subunit PhnH